MKQLGLMIDLKRCIGCKTCIVACRNHYELIDNENAMPNGLPYYLRVVKEINGKLNIISEVLNGLVNDLKIGVEDVVGKEAS